MIYGLLNIRIRERLRREEAENFSILLHKAREIEDSLDTSRVAPSLSRTSTTTAAPAPAPAAPPAGRRPSSGAPADKPPPVSTSSASQGKSPPQRSRPRSFCVYCKTPGHTREECRKLNSDMGDQKSDNVIACYGCGAKGVKVTM